MMSEKDEGLNSATDQYGQPAPPPTPAFGAMPSIAADRVYQIAALTAGLFLLVTLL